VTDAALNGLQETADLDVAGGDLNADELVVLFNSGVGGSVGLLVDEASDFLGQAVADIAELLVVAVDLVGVVAVGALPGVHLEVVGGPALGRVYRTREREHGILVEADHALLFGRRGPRVVDGGGHAGAESRRHIGR
jgi:hypothetical protein